MNAADLRLAAALTALAGAGLFFVSFKQIDAKYFAGGAIALAVASFF